MNDLIKSLSWDRIKIIWNKNPIKMAEFLGFLTVKTEISRDNIGYGTGWTERVGPNGLIISGGWVGGTEYLDTLQYGKNLHNPYNNYVTVFYLFEIMTEEGKFFFLNYYREDMKKKISEMEFNIENLESQITHKKESLKSSLDYLVEFGYKNTTP